MRSRYFDSGDNHRREFENRRSRDYPQDNSPRGQERQRRGDKNEYRNDYCPVEFRSRQRDYDDRRFDRGADQDASDWQYDNEEWTEEFETRYAPFQGTRSSEVESPYYHDSEEDRGEYGRVEQKGGPEYSRQGNPSFGSEYPFLRHQRDYNHARTRRVSSFYDRWEPQGPEQSRDRPRHRRSDRGHRR